MKKFMTLALVGAVMLGAGSVAFANVCAFDNTPAATLLYPFEAYNYAEGASGVNTLFSVTNTSSEAQIVHVTVWTDFSVAILDFNILLTGYDVQSMDIRTILAAGQLPVTQIQAHNTDEGIFDDGPVSQVNQYSPGDPINPPLRCGRPGLSWPLFGSDPGQHPRPVRGLAEEQPDCAAVSRQLQRCTLHAVALALVRSP